MCNICSNKVEEDDLKVIGCDLCEKWCHQECVGSADLIKLLDEITKANSNPSAEKFLGNLLWFCPKCLTGPAKSVTISKDSCALTKSSPRVQGGGGTQIDNSNNSNKPICKDYRHGKCKDGDSCQFSHPEKCLNYCRYGRNGCNSGFNKCKLLHPVLCRSSLNYGQCFDSNCTLAHLKGTVRKQNNANQFYTNPQSQEYQGNRVKRYTPYDTRNLGFQGYNQTRNHSQNRSGQFKEDYVYNPNDYPCLPKQQSSDNAYNNRKENQDFLDLLDAIHQMKEAQTFFHQELKSLKTQIINPARVPNNQGNYTQQQ